jgi:hypothetical protein
MFAQRTWITNLAVILSIAVSSPRTATGDDKQFSIYLDTDAPGYDYQQFDPPSLSYCQSRCGAEAKCRAFTYNVEKKVCFLKDKATFLLRPHGDAITGRKTSGGQFLIRRNRDAPGHDYERRDPPSLSDCQNLCGADQQCRAFTYNDAKKVCFLKYKSDIRLVRDAGAITGIKTFGYPPSNQPSASSGTGFAISADGLILTARHVVEDCESITVEGLGPGMLKASDRLNDLAVVKVDASVSPAMFRATPLDIGETVFVAGYPLAGVLGSGLHFSDGVVSSLTGIENDSRKLEITAPVQPGNSGGPLIDESGLVVGVVSSRLNEIAVLKESGSLPQNINFAIHGGLAMSFLRDNSFDPIVGSPSDALASSEVARKAKSYTFTINCLSGNSASSVNTGQDARQPLNGAIAYSPNTRRYGYSYNDTSRALAEADAMRYCQSYASDCKIVVRFSNACGALAIGPTGYGGAWGRTRADAEHNALDACGKFSKACHIEKWVCTSS